MSNINNFFNLVLLRVNRHLLYIVDNSPWSFLMSWSVFFLFSGLGFWIHHIDYSVMFIFVWLIFLVLCISCWWADIIKEGTFLGDHTLIVQRGLKIGFKLVILFIIKDAKTSFSRLGGDFFSGGLSNENLIIWLKNHRKKKIKV